MRLWILQLVKTWSSCVFFYSSFSPMLFRGPVFWLLRKKSMLNVCISAEALPDRLNNSLRLVKNLWVIERCKMTLLAWSRENALQTIIINVVLELKSIFCNWKSARTINNWKWKIDCRCKSKLFWINSTYS